MRIYDIVLDTNIMFSALYSNKGASFQIITKIGTNAFNLHISVPILFEYEEILKEKRKELGLTLKDIDDFIDYLCKVSYAHEIFFSWRPCLRDASDDMLLELSVSADCDFIVTHNVKHFKGIHGFNVKAITPGIFLGLLEGKL